MKHIRNYELFLEDMTNPNTPQGYLNSLSKKPKLKPQQNQQQNKQQNQNRNQQQNQQQSATDEIDNILVNTEDQKQQIVARKDAIEKGLLNNIQNMEPENQKDVKTQVNDYKTQVTEFDKTVKQIGQLNKTLKKSNIPNKQPSQMMKSREQNKL
jgi:hypothetical protein